MVTGAATPNQPCSTSAAQQHGSKGCSSTPDTTCPSLVLKQKHAEGLPEMDDGSEAAKEDPKLAPACGEGGEEFPHAATGGSRTVEVLQITTNAGVAASDSGRSASLASGPEAPSEQQRAEDAGALVHPLAEDALAQLVDALEQGVTAQEESMAQPQHVAQRNAGGEVPNGARADDECGGVSDEVGGSEELSYTHALGETQEAMHDDSAVLHGARWTEVRHRKRAERKTELSSGGRGQSDSDGEALQHRAEGFLGGVEEPLLTETAEHSAARHAVERRAAGHVKADCGRAFIAPAAFSRTARGPEELEAFRRLACALSGAQ